MSPTLRFLLALALVATLSRAADQVPFTLAATLTNGFYICAVTAADVNNDGRPDLICARDSPPYVFVWTNSGNGLFVSNASYAVGLSPRQVLAVDVNNDGWPDLVTPNLTADNLTILTNNRSGGYVLATNLPVGSGEPVSVAAADFFGRGQVDLVVANSKLPSFAIWTNAGGGLFASNASFVPTLISATRYVTTADVNGDGKPDIIGACAYASTNLWLWTNNGAGGFAAAPVPTFPSGIVCVVATDLNGDSKPDLALITNTVVTVLTNNGSGGFTVSGSNAVGPNPFAMVAADVNGDEKPDLIICNQGNNTLTVLTNNGSGGFGLNTTLSAGNYPESLAAADVNGDGRVDLISGNFYTALSVSVLTNASTFLPRLTLKRAGNNLIVTWPAIWANWSLQQNSGLAPAGWTAFGGLIGNDGITKSATNAAPAGNRFFRLSSP